jgi:hypothetical protein
MTLVELRDVRSLAERNPLAAAFLLSLIIHLSMLGVWRVGKDNHWWDHQATWLLHLRAKKPSALRLTPAQRAAQEAQKKREIPLTFVEVDPALASAEPPKEARHYGAVDSLAANPDVRLETTQPKLDGKQDKVVRTETVTKAQPLQPALPPEAPAAQARPKGGEAPGDLALAKTPDLRRPGDGVTEVDPGTAPRSRPKTLAEARSRLGLVGEQSRLDGGVKRRGRYSLDVKATPFGAYDAALIAAVQQRWYDLLDNTSFTQRSGKVVLEFRLHDDGRITALKMTANEVGELLGLLCQRAVLDPAPYARWPDDMRRLVGGTYREVLFTFHYY